MLEFILYYEKPLKYIVLIILVVFVILIWLLRKQIRDYIEENRSEMQRDPMQLAIVVFYDNMTKTPEEGGGKSFGVAFSALVFSILKEAFKNMMKPVYELGNTFIELFKSFQAVLDGIRKQIAVMRQMLTNIFRDIYNRIEVSMATIYYLFYKLRDTLKRMYATVFIMAYMVQHSVNFTENMLRFFTSVAGRMGDYGGILVSHFAMPIGLGGVAWKSANPNFCFDPQTRVLCLSGNSTILHNIKCMNQVEIGDRLYNPEDKTIHTVQSVFRFVPGVISYRDSSSYPKSTQGHMFNLNGVLVSGTHAVHQTGQFMNRVFEDERSHPLNEYHSPYGIISLITDTGLIPCSNGVVFRDYLDSHSTDAYSYIRKLTESHLNHTKFQPNVPDYDTDVSIDIDDCQDLYTGIVDKSGKWGYTDDRLLGTVEIGIGQLTMYEIEGLSHIQFSGNTWIQYDERWIRACQHPQSRYIGKNTEVAYQFFIKGCELDLYTDDGEHRIRIRDMLESDNEEYLQEQSQYLTEYGLLN
jgi:hypothetical protein